jgi:hypothetical protein
VDRVFHLDNNDLQGFLLGRRGRNGICQLDKDDLQSQV